MAWQTNPTFVDGAVLSAANLNILSDNLAFLYGRLQGVNMPFNSLRVTDTELDSSNNGWTIRHTHRYLHYSLTLISGDISGPVDLKIYYNGEENVIESSDTELAIPQTWSDYIDTNGFDPGNALTVGNYYVIYVTKDNNTNSVFSVDYLIESDATSI